MIDEHIISVDLLNKKFSINELINNIYLFNLIHILKTQDLTEEFVVNYILNPIYQLTEQEKKITLLDVLNYQPKLNHNKLLRLYFIGPIDSNKPNFEDII
jgi:hypothetical protein